MTRPTDNTIYAFAHLDEIWFSITTMEGDFCRCMEDGFDEFIEMVNACDIQGVYTIAHPDNWFLLGGVLQSIKTRAYRGNLFIGSPDMLASFDDVFYPPLAIRRMHNQIDRDETLGGFHLFTEPEHLYYEMTQEKCGPDDVPAGFLDHPTYNFFTSVGVHPGVAASIVNHIVDPRWMSYLNQSSIDISLASNAMYLLGFSQGRIAKLIRNKQPRPGKLADMLLFHLIQAIFDFMEVEQHPMPTLPEDLIRLVESFFDALMFIWFRSIYPVKSEFWPYPNQDNAFHRIWLKQLEVYG